MTQMTQSSLSTQNKKLGARVMENTEHLAPLCQTHENVRLNTAGLTSEAIAAPTDAHRFDAPTSLRKLRERHNKKRRQRFQQSRLTQWRAEIVALRQAGASYREIKAWLSAEKRIKLAHTDVLRFLKKLPEICEVESTTMHDISEIAGEETDHA